MAALGPYKDFVAFGEMIEPFAGLAELTGYADRAPLRLAVAYPDPVAGLHAALAILLALRQRQHTDAGQHIHIPHREPITRMLGEAVLDYTVNGRTQRRIGNRHRTWAPHGCYPCRGRDRWLTIAVRNDAEWTALCRVIGEPAWTHDPCFANSFRRWKHADRLDQLRRRGYTAVGGYRSRHTSVCRGDPRWRSPDQSGPILRCAPPARGRPFG